MSPQRHLARIGLLMAAAALLLSMLAFRTEIIFADGLRYIAQARTLDQGSWAKALVRGEDHPVYPLAIAALHRVRGGDEPSDWQAAAQWASVLAGTLLVIPLYLCALEVHGATAAWLACLLTFLVPLTGHVLADALSEGTFLLFWTSGCWCGLRFLRRGSTAWLLGAIVMGGLAYLTRPEGLLLPVALAGLLVLSLVRLSLRLEGAAGRRAWAILVVGPLLFVGPYVVAKGGLGTKPAVGRLLGLAPRSGAMAVERERPLDPDQSWLKGAGVAFRGAGMAVLGAVPPWLLVLAALAFPVAARDPGRSRAHAFIGLITVGWLVAMVRLYATSGYCTPRHALILALPCLALAARGMVELSDRVASAVARRWRVVSPSLVQRGLVGAVLLATGVLLGRGLMAPPNHGFRGYRLAGDWIASHVSPDARVLDLKGWSLFYGQRPGYTFGEVGLAQDDRSLGWVVAHDSLLIGPWAYCDVVRKVVGDRAPVKSFPEQRQRGVAQVHVYDLRPAVARAGTAADQPRPR